MQVCDEGECEYSIYLREEVPIRTVSAAMYSYCGDMIYILTISYASTVYISICASIHLLLQ